ncbi:MAG TPA: hypothetical protein VLR26_08970 [Frankiaceae bacterium]|nr:hypothetical protein [Frankiaceae bacterium]
MNTQPVGRPPFGSSVGSVRTLGAAGTGAAAVVAHVSGGAALPSPVLLAAAVTAVWALATVADRLPAPCRTVRLRLAAAVALQPVLHALFDLRVSSGPPTATTALMVLAHLTAAGVTVWWLDRGAARLVALAGSVVGRLARSSPTIMPIGARRPMSAPSLPRLDGRDPLVGLRRRGPPVGTVRI